MLLIKVAGEPAVLQPLPPAGTPSGSAPASPICQDPSTIIFLMERPLYQLAAEQEKQIKSSQKKGNLLPSLNSLEPEFLLALAS